MIARELLYGITFKNRFATFYTKKANSEDFTIFRVMKGTLTCSTERKTSKKEELDLEAMT